MAEDRYADKCTYSRAGENKNNDRSVKTAMKKIKLFVLIVLIQLIFLICFSGALGMGILTPFIECKMDNLKPGKRYSTARMRNMPLKVKNAGENEVRVKIEVLKPAKGELRQGYEQIPDVSWISMEKDSFNLKPGSYDQTDVFVEVPKKKEYYGKKYQAFLLIGTAGGGRIQAGLKSLILFSVQEKKGVFRRIWGLIWK